MNISIRRTLGILAGITVAAGIGAGTAAAVPPAVTPQPGGVIRLDPAPGEVWSCQGWSLQAPFFQIAPNMYQPGPYVLHFTPGADVFVQCSGTGAPFVWYGPIVKAGA